MRPALEYAGTDAGGVDAGFGQQVFATGVMLELVRQAQVQHRQDDAFGVEQFGDAGAGTAFITEGLINYFPREQVVGIWGRIATALGRFPNGVYLSDLFLREGNDGLVEKAFGLALGGFVRGSIYFPFADETDAVEQLVAAGFTSAELHPGTETSTDPGAERVHVIEART